MELFATCIYFCVIILTCPATGRTASLSVASSSLKDSGVALFNSTQLVRHKREDCTENSVFLLNELIELGKDARTVCPFETKTKSMELEHPSGKVTIQFNQIVCSRDCTNCGGGRSCKQLKTNLEITVNNTVYLADVDSGCSCTPDDDGSPGEVVHR